MTLSNYHQKYTDQSDEEIIRRINEKEEELKAIFDQISLKTKNDGIRVAVLGCGDKRFVKAHKQMFEKYTSKQVDLTTFDITVDHLQGENNVVQHNCIFPLPRQPFDITYAHVLLKFIETDKQLNLIKNSYEALTPGGIAIHVLDKEEVESNTEKLLDGYFSVPLELWKQKLSQEGVNFKEIKIKYGLVLVLQK